MRLPLLIVDDDEKTIVSTKDLLGTSFQVLSAGPPEPVESAIRIWTEHPELKFAIIDLKIVDNSRRFDAESAGLRLTAFLKERRPGARIAIRSASEYHDNLAKAIDGGADGYVAKDWSRDQFLANVELLTGSTTTAAALHVLIERTEARVPWLVGHSRRVKEWCRALVTQLNHANPKNFDLAVCMTAADLHDLGWALFSDDMLSASHHPALRHVWRHLDQEQASPRLRDFGLGFERVERIVGLRHCHYTVVGSASDSSHAAILPHGEGLPLEARVLGLAETLDTLLASPAAYNLHGALVAVRGYAEAGIVDPRLLTALELLIKNDSRRIERLYVPDKSSPPQEINLHYSGSRVTARRVQEYITQLMDIELSQGRVADRMNVVRIETDEREDQSIFKMRLAGSEADVSDLVAALSKLGAVLNIARPDAKIDEGVVEQLYAASKLPKQIERLPRDS